MWEKLKGKEAWVKENGEEAKGYVELGVMENGGLGVMENSGLGVMGNGGLVKRNVEQEGANS